MSYPFDPWQKPNFLKKTCSKYFRTDMKLQFLLEIFKRIPNMSQKFLAFRMEYLAYYTAFYSIMQLAAPLDHMDLVLSQFFLAI